MDTYPESRKYSWESFGETSVYISGRKSPTWTKIASHCLNAATKSEQRASWKDVLEALEALECDYDIHALTAKKFKQLVVGAAKQNNWMRRTSTRKGFTAFVEGQPDMRRCYKCAVAKPIADFRAVVSEAKKEIYRHSKNERTYYTHTLCSHCRASRRAKASAKPIARRGKGVTPDAFENAQRLRARMTMFYMRSKHQISRDTAELNAATAFHKMRLKLIDAARAELERRLFKGEEVPEDWRFLLEKDMRTRLHNTFNEVILPAWSGRGRTPSCF